MTENEQPKSIYAISFESVSKASPKISKKKFLKYREDRLNKMSNMTENEQVLAAHREWLKKHRMRLQMLSMATLQETDKAIEAINDELRRAERRRRIEENAQQGLGL